MVYSEHCWLLKLHLTPFFRFTVQLISLSFKALPRRNTEASKAVDLNIIVSAEVMWSGRHTRLRRKMFDHCVINNCCRRALNTSKQGLYLF